jgi:hypothetical protein
MKAMPIQKADQRPKERTTASVVRRWVGRMRVSVTMVLRVVAFFLGRLGVWRRAV